MRKIGIVLVIIIFLTFIASSNYSMQDINDMAYVVAIGVDVRGK